jgi:hypothetical protein
VPGYEGAFAEIEDYTVAFGGAGSPTKSGAMSASSLYPHWGYVIRGKLSYHLTDGAVLEIGPGEAYYVGPGHTPQLYAGTEVVEFSPTAELAKTMAVVLRNAGGGG